MDLKWWTNDPFYESKRDLTDESFCISSYYKELWLKLVNEWTWSQKCEHKYMKKQNLNVDIDGDFKKQTEIENKTCHF